jgi:hypothetical protein
MTKISYHDFGIEAYHIVEKAAEDKETVKTEAIQIEGKNPHAVALGRLGGLKGGPARAEKLTPDQRKEIAMKASRTRWEKKRKTI